MNTIKKTIQFHDVTLRDGQQSMAATRMTTGQVLRVLPFIEAAGYESIELWGGAVPDSCIRYLNEDPWERLEACAAQLKNPDKIQALLRGQNLFAYSPFPDDLVIAFIRQALRSGVKVMRIFDALNDRRNLQIPLLAAKAYGGVVEAAISYTTSPVHTQEMFVDYAKELAEDGADRICLKDMAGILHPKTAVTLLPALRAQIQIPITLHSHSTTGVGLLNAVIAMMSGIDAIDTAITPFCEGSSHPSVEVLMVFAEQMGLEHGLDVRALQHAQRELWTIAAELSEHNAQLKEYYRPFSIQDVDRRAVDRVISELGKGSEGIDLALADCRKILADLRFPPYDDRIFSSQIPGGMLTNLQAQLKQMGAPDSLNEVMQEFPRVRADAGYVPLVTPTSQIIGSQAVFNVICGERYQIISDEFSMLLRGEFGRTPVPPNPDLVRQAVSQKGGEYKYRPATYLKPLMEDPCTLPFVQSHKDLLLHLMLGQSADDFLKRNRVLFPQGSAVIEIEDEDYSAAAIA